MCTTTKTPRIALTQRLVSHALPLSLSHVMFGSVLQSDLHHTHLYSVGVPACVLYIDYLRVVVSKMDGLLVTIFDSYE